MQPVVDTTAMQIHHAVRMTATPIRKPGDRPDVGAVAAARRRV